MPPPQRGFNRRYGNNDGARMRMDSYHQRSNQFDRDVRGGGRGGGGGGGGGYRRNNMRYRPSSSPRRREMGHMMQHARRDRDNQSSYWTKRLLEAEEKDPNRWRHSGFKEMYRDELKDQSGSRDDSISSASSRSRSRSPVSRPKSPGGNRSPQQDRASQRRPRPRSPPSPPSKRGGSRDKSRGRPRTPSHKRSTSRQNSRRSESFSSSETLSSCSDDSCSVCTPKHGKRTPPTPPTPPPKKKTTMKKSTKKEEPVKKIAKVRKQSPPRKKKGDTRRPKSPPPPRTPESTSSTSSSSSESESSSEDALEQPRVSLSERFGKMAQWSVDRKEYDQIKMKITKDAGTSGMKVVIENDTECPTIPQHVVERPIVRSETPDKDYAFHYESRRYFFERSFTRERPVGPDVPLNWNDPMARYSYYRSKSLLWEPEVSFDEYIKWEAWWQRYQEWLDVEKSYFGEDVALDNARRERERDWESYRSSNMGRTMFERELSLPLNQPWNRTPNIMIRGRGGIITRRKFVNNI